MPTIDSKLLSELHIDGAQREGREVAPARGRWIALGAVVVAAAGMALGTWWWLGTRPLAVRTATATAASASSGSTAAVLQATGYVTARRQATVSTQITGTLTQVLIEAGDRVRKGQVIARLEDSALRASLNVAQANLQTAQAQVAQAQAQLAQSEADARRQAELAAAGMLSPQAAEQARTAVATVGAQLEARRREVDAMRSLLAQAQVNFDYTIVRAPFAGVVTVKAAQVGEIVSPFSAGGGFTRTGVGTIVDMDSLEVDVDVNEAFIGQVRPQMPAESVLDAYPDWKVPSRVIAIVPTADRGKATVRVRVALDTKDARLVPDMGVRVSFFASSPAAAASSASAASSPSAAAAAPVALPGVVVPAQALATRDGRTVVFVVADGRARQRELKAVADAGAAFKRVPEGLRAGERVVLSPPAELRDGAAVSLVENDAR
ncbi:MAG: efflux RND transporter periplasmic adaptor subunit [Burkholderiales bacterium]|nr:efflux RND transporter periplasmic adaptor subunit [Burkholderiales bacterium]